MQLIEAIESTLPCHQVEISVRLLGGLAWTRTCEAQLLNAGTATKQSCAFCEQHKLHTSVPTCMPTTDRLACLFVYLPTSYPPAAYLPTDRLTFLPSTMYLPSERSTLLNAACPPT